MFLRVHSYSIVHTRMTRMLHAICWLQVFTVKFKVRLELGKRLCQRIKLLDEVFSEKLELIDEVETEGG